MRGRGGFWNAGVMALSKKNQTKKSTVGRVQQFAEIKYNTNIYDHHHILLSSCVGHTGVINSYFFGTGL